VKRYKNIVFFVDATTIFAGLASVFRQIGAGGWISFSDYFRLC
jgi:hypothetical protein